MDEKLKEFKAKFKAFLVAKSWDNDMTDGGGCETCGYGAREGFSIEKIQELVDEFDPEKVS